jgi:hypothetical protein
LVRRKNNLGFIDEVVAIKPLLLATTQLFDLFFALSLEIYRFQQRPGINCLIVKSGK